MRVLLVGPYDPHGGEFSFVSPPLGIWRICGFLRARGVECEVFDPNLSSDPYGDLDSALASARPAVVGFSLTGMTLAWDLSLVHWARRACPGALFVGGGIEATFNYRTVFAEAPLDHCVVGEGELPLLAICESLERSGAVDPSLPGLVSREGSGFRVEPNRQLGDDLFRSAALAVPYRDMPIRSYWRRLGGPEGGALEANTVRIMTSNLCPMGCRFCSYTNFLRHSCGRSPRVVRLGGADVAVIVRDVVGAYPDVKTILFQDDLFVFRNDDRIHELCRELVGLRCAGLLPPDLGFIATSRVDTVREDMLDAMAQAGFRLLGYGVESFSRRVLREFGKEEIHPFIEPTIRATLERGITPFLDVILASPESHLGDVVLTLGKCLEYLRLGCEVSIYPTVIPFAGSALAEDPALQELIVSERREIARTGRSLVRGVSIEPRQAEVRRFLEDVGQAYGARLRAHLAGRRGTTRLPSRERSVLYVLSALDTYPELFEGMAEGRGPGRGLGAAGWTLGNGREADGGREAQAGVP